jgi:type III secretory pathway component EscU
MTDTTTTATSANDIQNEMSAYSSNYGDKYLKQRIHRSCAIMKKPTVLTVCIDGNRRQIVAAKRTGDAM